MVDRMGSGATRVLTGERDGLREEVSNRIAILRALLIYGILVVHIPYAGHPDAGSGEASFFSWFRTLLGDVAFRSGVPCLSAISGYLLFSRGIRTSYANFARKKFTTLVIPLLVWNALVYVLVLGAQGFGVANGYFPDLRAAPPRETMNLLLSISGEPINLPLYFLRDLFACMIMAPAIGFAVRIAPIPTLLLLLAVSMNFIGQPFFLRADIVLSFAIGATLALHKVDVTALDRSWRAWGAIFVVLSCLLALALTLVDSASPTWIFYGKKLLALIGALAFWTLSSVLSRTAPGARLGEASQHSFWVFCSHYPAMMILWMIWNKYCGPDYYLVFYFGCMALAFPALAILHVILRSRLGKVIAIVDGGRSR
ncbi:acyltransferase [Tautonia sp. JC769]|uniref:acyltransferase family protein n=1 Tax=Tautonia sp. JC769 TaxID=3232135 RepID=UPI00345A64C4